MPTNELYHMIDASGVGVPLPPDARPDKLAPISPGIAVGRAYGYTGGVRSDDGLGTLEQLVIGWTEAQPTEAALEARLRMYNAAATRMVWLARAGRSSLATSGGLITATPLGKSKRAHFTLTVAAVSTTALDSSGQAVSF